MKGDELLLLDTHVWFRHQVWPRLIRPATALLIDQAALRRAVFVSVISIWEFAMLERSGRIELSGGVERWTQEALAKPGLSLLPLSPRIAIESVQLSEPMHKDPADRILVASARVERMTLVTADKLILNFAKQSGLAHLRA